LADAGIDIGYNGDPLSAATTAAIDSLSGKGWQVYINGELVIPNILDLEPAAAYSLRSFDADADPNVVNVRRSSDGATSDFTASEVSDGTLRDWTLGDTLALENNRMYFDGVNDKVDVSGVDISSYSEITIKTRVLWNDGVETAEGIFTNNNTGAGRFSLNLSGNTLFVVVDSGSNSETRSQTIQTGRYYNIVASAKLDGTTLKLNLFVDGVETGELSVSSTQTDFNHITQNWVIGYLNNARYFEGIIDYVDVYEGYSTDGSVTGMTQLHGWSNTNITDASWTDSVGSANGTVSGTPALFSGQGFDGHVTTWYDQSDNGNDSTQTDVSYMPKIVDAGTLVTDSSNNPAIIGDGVDDTLSHPTLTDEIDSSDFLVTAAYEDELAMGIVGSVPRLYLTSSSMSYNTLGTVGYSKQTGRNVMSFQVAGNTQEVFGNGASLGTASEAQVDLGQNMFNVLQGGSTFSDGPLMEVVVFGDNQSANRTGIENNINDHFDIYS